MSANNLPKSRVWFSFVLVAALVVGLLLAMVGLALLWTRPAKAAAGPTLSISMSVVTPQPVLAGNPVTWDISWQCSSVEATPCTGARIDVTRPEPTVPFYIDLGSAVGSPGFTTSAFVDGTGAHFVFIDPLRAGSSGTVQVQYPSLNLRTPDGTVLTPVATFSATNASSVQASAGAEIDAATHLAITKRRLATPEPPLDVDVTYEIVAFDPSWPNFTNPPPGTWSVVNAVVSDTLPPGSVFVSATDGGTYNAATHTVTWPAIPELAFEGVLGHGSPHFYVTIRYPSPPFTADDDPADPSDNVTNTVTVVGKPFGQPTAPDVTAQASVTHGFVNQPVVSGTFAKALSGCALKVSSGVRGGAAGFDLCWSNPSSVPATFTATDRLPCPVDSPTGLLTPCVNLGFRPTKFRVRYPVISGTVAVMYTTNQGNTGRLSFTTPIVYKSPGVDDDVPRTFSPGEFVSHFTVTGSLAGGFSQFLQVEGTIAPDFPDDPAIDPDVMTNCAEGSLDFGAFGGVLGPFNSCVRIEIVPPKPVIYHFKGGLSLGAIAPTEARIFSLAAAPCGDLPWRPVVTDFLPANLRYVPGTQDSNYLVFPSLGGVPPTFEVIEDYNGTGRQLLRWSWPGGQAMAECQYLGVSFQARVEPGTPPGTYTNYGQFFDAAFTNNNTPLTNICIYGREPDAGDFDGDGNTTEYRCFATTDYTVVQTASMVVIKEVRGSFDAAFQAPPAIGLVDPGSPAEYRITLQNTGNLSLTNFVAYDILPFVGDTGVSGTQLGTPRGSQWQPVLAGAVTPPAGGTVEYSMSTNPCRGEVITQGGTLASGPPGCVNDWTTSPASFSAVRAIRISLGSTVLAGGESRSVIVPMTAPLGVEGIAWNTAALAGQRADTSAWLLPTEPPKVGLAVPIDLELDKAVSPATSASPGATLTYNVTVTNRGPGSATGVTVKDVLSAGLTFQSAVPAASYDSGTGVWTVGSLTVNGSATLTIMATVNAGSEGTTITNYTQVSAANELDLDSAPNNNPGPTPSEDDEDAVSTPIQTSGRQGCSHGYWKTNAQKRDGIAWVPTGYSPTQTVVSVFSSASIYPDSIKNATLLQALEFPGGAGVNDAARILLKQAVAALLNAAHPNINYPLSPTDVINQVNSVLDAQDRSALISLASTLDGYNNLGCPLNSRGIPQLTSFSATALGNGIVVRWTTVVEQYTSGFHLWRSTTGQRADAARVTTTLIPGQGGSGGASYSWKDTSVQGGTWYTYWLEEVELDNTTNEYGPTQPVLLPPGGGYRIFLPSVVR